VCVVAFGVCVVWFPGGIRITEGGMVGLLLLEGIDYTSAISAVILVRIVTLWFSVAIGLTVLKTKI